MDQMTSSSMAKMSLLLYLFIFLAISWYIGKVFKPLIYHSYTLFGYRSRWSVGHNPWIRPIVEFWRILSHAS